MRKELPPSCRIQVADPCKALDCPAIYDLSRPLEIEVGCGKGRFLTSRAAKNPDCEFLGIERMLSRVQSFDGKVRRAGLKNAHILRLEALYTFWYLLPLHHARTVYVFFPDPWPKKKHHSHRLFGPLFLNALWQRLEIGGTLQFSTDHEEYFHTVEECFEADEAERKAKGRAPRYKRVEPMVRGEEEWTEFETLFRGQGLPIFSAAWTALDVDDPPLEPMKVAPEDEPREGIERRNSKGKEWREEHAED